VGLALRTFVGVLVGILVAFVLVVAVEFFSTAVYPLPEGLENIKDEKAYMDAMCKHVAAYPQWVLAAAVPMWGAAALAGAWTARKLGNVWSALVVGLLLMALLVMNLSMLPYVMWFKVTSLVVIPAALLAGGGLAAPRRGPAIGEAP